MFHSTILSEIYLRFIVSCFDFSFLVKLNVNFILAFEAVSEALISLLLVIV